MRQHLRARSPDSLIIDELGIGSAIADMALVSAETFIGYEIKSAADSVKRLPRQVEAYSAVFDRCAVVLDPRHTDRAQPLLPSWWGIILIEDARFLLLRDLDANPEVDAAQLLKLLWRDEAYLALEALGYAPDKTAQKRRLHQRLQEALTVGEARALARHTLLNRREWLIDEGRGKAAFSKRSRRPPRSTTEQAHALVTALGR